MSQMPGTTEEKIIEAAVGCIEKYGIDGTTIRRIAETAGVNSAAISYYFRSKDRLMEKVLEQTLRNAFDWGDFRDSEAFPPKERLIAILDHLMTGGLNFPGTARAHFYDSFVNSRYDTPAVKRLNEFLAELESDLRNRGAVPDSVELRMAIVQIVASSFLLTGVVPRLFEEFSGFNLYDPEIRKKYLTRLVERLL